MSSKNCSVCLLQQLKSAPKTWCPLCEECLCLSCSKHHEVQNATRDHTTISFEDYNKLPPFILNVKLTCEEHKEKYQYYCRSHDCPVCRKCLFESHKKCEDTPDINNVSHNIKKSAVFEDKWRDLEEIHQIFLTALKKIEENLGDLKEKRKEITTKVIERTQRLMGQLKELENKTLLEIDSAINEQSNEIEGTIKVLKSKEQNLAEMLEQKVLIMKHASNFQTFIGIKGMEREVKDSEDTMKKLSDRGAINHIDFQVEENDKVEDTIFGLKSFGNIKISKEKKTLSIDRPNTAQKMVQNIFPKQLTLKQEFALGEDKYYGCCTMPNGLMVFACFQNKEVNIVKPDGSFKSSVKLIGNVRDITTINENHVAVSIRKSDIIFIIDINNSKIIKTLKTENEVSGLTHYHDNIVFCVPKKGIMLINKDTERIDKVCDDEFVGVVSRIDTDGSRICYTRYGMDKVAVLDYDYRVIFTFTNENLSGPIGISMDQHQNMFAFCNALLLISRDGDMSEVLLSLGDTLFSPMAVHYDKENGELLIVDGNHVVRKYNVS